MCWLRGCIQSADNDFAAFACQIGLLFVFHSLFTGLFFQLVRCNELDVGLSIMHTKGRHTLGWERSGLVVECLTRDRGAAGLSLIGVTALCP